MGDISAPIHGLIRVKTPLANGFKTFFNKSNPVFRSGLKSLPKNPSDCPTLCKWVFHNFILADEPFAKSLRSSETYVLVNNNLCTKLFSSLESPKTLKLTSVLFFIPHLSYYVAN